jgi:predicted nucleic acid-binding protein
VLYPVWLRDALLRMAEVEVFRVLWSAEILDEMARNVLENNPHLDPAVVSRTVEEMNHAFPDASVTEYEALIPTMTNDPKDRHVLAAAIRGRADVIVTNNPRHFPVSARDLYNIDVQDADSFLMNQFELAREETVEMLQRWSEDLRSPPLTPDQILAILGRSMPEFSTAVRSWMEQYSE